MYLSIVLNSMVHRRLSFFLRTCKEIFPVTFVSCLQVPRCVPNVQNTVVLCSRFCFSRSELVLVRNLPVDCLVFGLLRLAPLADPVGLASEQVVPGGHLPVLFDFVGHPSG